MSANRDDRIPVAILGATGAVGQTFVRRLVGHPWFRIAELAASDRSSGRLYAEAVNWLEGTLPPDVAALGVLGCDPRLVTSSIVFSALDASAAADIEPAFAAAGRFVLSNAKHFRMDEDVPLLIPEVNAGQVALVDRQRAGRGWRGAVVTNANCAATVAAVALAPLHEAFGIERLFVTTMQAVSGAGYPGVPSLDILGNVIPYIADEEPKIERELPKLLGRTEDGTLAPATFRVSAQANRVPVEHGHTVCMSVGLARRVRVAEAAEALHAWRGDARARGLPSAPERPLVLSTDPRRPQARRDVGLGDGMTVTAGRLREDPILDLRLVALGHNTVRGAAGGAVLNAELLVSEGYLRRS